MSVIRLEVAFLRNLQSVSLLPHSRVNLLIGPNGSGKSSVLEALHLLSFGRSFRSGRIRRLVNDGQSACTVFACFENGGQAGIQRHANGDTVLKLDGRSHVAIAELAQRLPLVLLDPDSMGFLDEGSKLRRAQMDWGVFHVEHRFYPVWLRYQRTLKQRNSLLRSGSISRLESASWDKELADSANLLHQFRQDFVNHWMPLWEACVQDFLPDQDLCLDYHPGWNTAAPLANLLAESWEKDREKGYTQIGPHRADLRVKKGNVPANELLSRGQKKLLVCALKLSQVSLLKKTGKDCVVLVDDLASELDMQARQRLIDCLMASGAQVFITSIEPEAVIPVLEATGGRYKLFHVEHGTVRESTL